ncbi:MAG: hypothetical protein KKH40_01615, partial [Nanoarchaeota archaeon]|nr:hypothetical protein [Nanoarchaeota archaeon]
EQEGFENYFAKTAKTKFENELNVQVQELYSFIDQCRKMVDISQIDDAKNEYLKIKSLFGKTPMDPADRAMLYNSIRELYDDINLAMLK